MKKILLALIFGLAILLLFQEGTAPTCNNFHGTKPEHKCACAKAMKCHEPGQPQEEDKACKTYCRKADCHCVGPCES